MAQTDTSGERLTPAQARAVAALLTERTQEQAAIVARVSRRTLARWLTQENFRYALSVAVADLFGDLARGLAVTSPGAVAVLAELYTNPETPAATRRAAASDVIGHAVRLRELTETETRLQALEELAKQWQQPNG